MKSHRSIAWMALALVLMLPQVSPAAADSANRVTWYVIASGGGRSNSPNYTLDGTVGQTAPGLAHSQNYRLGSGFWYVAGMPKVVERLVFLPTVLKAYQ